MSDDTTHAGLVDRAARWLRGTMKCSVVFAEMVTSAPMSPDAIGWTWSGQWSILVEVKVSRGDFFADRKKVHWGGPGSPGQERWYMTPPGLVRPDELPDEWGLVECHAQICRVVHAAARTRHDAYRHRPGGPGACQPVHLPDRQYWEMVMLASAARRYELGAQWLPDRSRFAPYSGPVE